MNTRLLVELFSHMEWADAAVWTSLLASPSGPPDSKLQECLYHMHLAQWAFLRTWRGEARDTPYPEFEDARSLMVWARSYHGEVQGHLRTLDDERLAEAMPLPWAAIVEKRLGCPPHMTTVGETALQVILHSNYHLGQANARLRAVGGTPPLVDYIAWLWLGRPAATWPVTACEGTDVGPG